MGFRHLLLILIFLSTIIMMPVIFNTRSFPIVVVDGNSMQPNVLNGDIVVYQGANFENIAKNSIIIYEQGQTGFSILDSILKPTVIHRVVEITTEDGLIKYRTKGDNNQLADQFLVRYDDILGSPVLIIPKLGLVFLFLKSPTGVLSVVTLLVLYCIYIHTKKMKKEKRRDKLIAILAEMVLSAKMERDLFDKLKLVIDHFDSISMDNIKESKVLALMDWIRSGGLEHDLRLEQARCPECRTPAVVITGGNDNQCILCPRASCSAPSRSS